MTKVAKRIESVADAKAWLGEDHYLLKVRAQEHLTGAEFVSLARAIQSVHIVLSRSICAVRDRNFVIPQLN